MAPETEKRAWLPKVQRTDGPLYLSIAEVIAEDIRSGVLTPGQRLPPQRALAKALGVDFTTVSRAYAAAARQNLVEGRVGQGTYVKPRISEGGGRAAPDRTVDMSMNMPPRFDDPGLVQQMWGSFHDLGLEKGDSFLMRYQRPGGSAEDRDAARGWLEAQFGLEGAAQVVLCNGVQGALLSILSLLAKPGDTLCCEAITFPGFLAVAKYLGLNLVPVEMDAEGLRPDALEAVCETHGPKALYTIPTLHNPTTATLSSERRQRIAEIARRHDLTVLEDDAYGALAAEAPPPLARHAPERTWHICTTSKCLAPSLRVCFVTPPQGASNEGLKRAIRANGGVVSPISAGLVTTWLSSGLAAQITSAILVETRARQAAFAEAVPGIPLRDGAFHVWMPLPEGQSATDLAFALRGSGLGILPGQAFACGAPVNAVRIALGSPDRLGDLRRELRGLVEALKNPGEAAWMAV
ncbi:PLP-dependent aminotransferase family protein [Dinoroseobacter sp. S124A]|uniref:aminotransferase-like domain-containing protein n=1 Tax=Dinoroseobacter sp. S124A TaxID=3415128 RepID=UPI003C7C4398